MPNKHKTVLLAQLRSINVRPSQISMNTANNDKIVLRHLMEKRAHGVIDQGNMTEFPHHLLSIISPYMTADTIGTAVLVLEVIEHYLRRRADGEDMFERIGKARLVNQIGLFVNANQPIEFVLPAFPIKSPSLRKVLGVLPDRGEELALLHLDGFCEAIKNVYSPGARLVLVSDGITYEGTWLSNSAS